MLYKKGVIRTMRKRILILILAGMFCLAGCDQNAENPPEEPGTQDEQKNSKDTEVPEEDGEDEDGQEQESQNNQKTGQDSDEPNEEQKPAESVKIDVYSSNDDATAFQTTEVTIGSVSPEAVLKALADQGAVSGEVQINSLNQTTVDGKDSLEIDFNGAFASYVSSMGTTGEYYVMGSVCNTFLSAYGCEQIKITVDGGILTTGHSEYTEYMGMFS